MPGSADHHRPEAPEVGRDGTWGGPPVTRVGPRRLTMHLACTGILGLVAPVGIASAQDAAPERGHGLTGEEAAAGWISLFDGATTFGWSGARCDGGRLVGGTTTAELGDCELRGELDRGG